MRYRQVRVISGRGPAPDQFAEALRGLALDSAGRLYAVGDSKLSIFASEGKLLRSWPTERPGYCVAVRGDGTVWVGEPRLVEVFDAEGARLHTWRDEDRMGLVTAIDFSGEYVLLADTEDRCIRRYDRQFDLVNDIGKDNRMKGFLVPNRHLDFAVDGRGVIHAANPGKHRVERYALTGELLGHFGRFDGVDPEGFGGCCNPTNLALLPRDRVVVTEKAGPRVKVYDADGKLLGVWGEGDFDPACKNMDVAVDARDRIYVIDTVRLHVCIFAADDAAASSRPAEPATSRAGGP